MKNQIIRLTITMPFGEIKEVIYPTLICDENFVILVDCGFMGSLPLLEKELRKHGLTLLDLTGLVLTHHDHDHMGTAAEIKRVNQRVKIYASKEETPYISASTKPLRLQQAEDLQKTLPLEKQAFGKAFCEMLKRVEPVEVDEFLYDGQYLDWYGGCKVIATPGHTPGHISLLVENEAIIITGDAFVLDNGVPVIANPQFTLDIEKATNSMCKLLSMNVKTYYCYHGGIYLKNHDFNTID